MIRRFAEPNAWFIHYSSDKFRKDRVFEESQNRVIGFEGTILNRTALCQQSGSSNITELLDYDNTRRPYAFLENWRGDFCGLIWERKRNRLRLFNNQIGSRPIFYYFNVEDNVLFFGTDIPFLSKLVRLSGYPVRLDDEGAWMMLSFGFMLGDRTLINEMRRLGAGQALSYENGRIEINQYFLFRNDPDVSLDLGSAAEGIHHWFGEAVHLEFLKDKEEGRSHVATLSGGLDSRMTVAYGREYADRPITAITMSAPNYLDARIAQKIATDWGLEFVFYSLGKGDFLKDIELPVWVNGGLTHLTGSAHMLAMVQKLDWVPWGGLHTGMLGDAVLGTYLTNRHIEKRDPLSGGSLLRKDWYPVDLARKYWEPFPNDEMYKFYNRGVNGIFNGYQVIGHFTDFYSPFLYLDLLKFCFSIPPAYRYSGAIYKTWIARYQADSARYRWASTGYRPLTSKWMTIPRRYWRGAIRRLIGEGPVSNMNPFEYWFRVNGGLRKSWQDYYHGHLDLLVKKDLRRQAERIYSEGLWTEKGQVMTLLVACEIFGLT